MSDPILARVAQHPCERVSRAAAQAPIGVFDSGVGGLSVLRAIRAQMPGESLIYVADSGNAPYGDREPGFIAGRAVAITRFLLAQGAKAIVVACNTATAVAAGALRSWCPVPVVAIEPAIKPAAAGTRSGVIGVLATTRTLASASFERLCRLHAGDVDVRPMPCPGLVEQVERGDLDGERTRALLRGYVSPLLDAGADTIVLGCTHYPFLAPAIREIAGPGVTLIDPAAAVARELGRRLGAASTAPGQGEGASAAAAGALDARRDAERRAGATAFYTSGSPDAMRAVVGALWGADVEVLPLPELTASASDTPS